MPHYHTTDFPLGPVQLARPVGRPRVGIVLREFQFESPTLGLITVEQGFDTDYASVPRIFWPIYPPDGDYTDAAVIHDFLYWHQCVPGTDITGIERHMADRVFYEAMTALGIPWLRRHLLHKAVRLGGWIAWRKRARELSAHEN